MIRMTAAIGHFLDRRVFLPSYDPSADDERGSNLERVLAPALTVGTFHSAAYIIVLQIYVSMIYVGV